MTGNTAQQNEQETTREAVERMEAALNHLTAVMQQHETKLESVERVETALNRVAAAIQEDEPEIRPEEKPGLLDKIDRVITAFVYGVWSIPIIIFTLIWFGVSFYLFYIVTKVIFFS